MNRPHALDHRTGAAGAVAFSPLFHSASAPSFAEALVDPGGVFQSPDDIAEHPCFTHEEKRTFLLSWARDELVLEQVANRSMPELKPRSRIDAVLEALARFDPLAAGEYRMDVAAIRAQHPGRSGCSSGLHRP